MFSWYVAYVLLSSSSSSSSLSPIQIVHSSFLGTAHWLTPSCHGGYPLATFNVFKDTSQQLSHKAIYKSNGRLSRTWHVKKLDWLYNRSWCSLKDMNRNSFLGNGMSVLSHFWLKLKGSQNFDFFADRASQYNVSN